MSAVVGTEEMAESRRTRSKTPWNTYYLKDY